MLRTLLLAAAVAAAGRAADPPPEFALVPADAAGVAHVRLADLWHNPAMADYRAVVAKAGDKAVATLDSQFVPPPSTIDRLTVFLMLPPGGGDPQAVFVARFTKPFDAGQVRQAYMPNAKAETTGGKEFFADGNNLAAHFPDAHTLMLSDRAGMTAYLGRKSAAGGKLAEALKANAGKPLVVVANVKAIPIPPDALKQVPPDFKPILDAELVTFTLSLDAAPSFAARLVYGSPDEATAADVALKKGLKMLKPLIAQQRVQLEQELAGKTPAGQFRPLTELPMAVGAVAGLGTLAQLDELLDIPPLKKDGNALAAEVTLPGGTTGTVAVAAIGVGLALPAVQKVRESAARAQSMNNLKQIALALHMYHDTHGSFPPAAITDKTTGKPLLSWRVAILPFIEQDALYKQFKLDEPWDSPNNLPLSKMMIKVYTDPRGTATEPGLTYYKAFVGGGAAWDWKTGRKLQQFTDGTSNTLIVGAVGLPVPWSKPDDVEFNPNAAPNLFTAPFNGLLAAFADGSVRFISPTIEPKVLKALLTAAGGEQVGPIP